MTWSTPADLKAQLARLWERGELLRDALSGHDRFPLRLTLKSPGSADIADRFDAVRQWTAGLSAPHLRVEWQEVRHRVQGSQRLPAGAWVDSIEDALGWLGKRRDWDRFQTQIAATRAANPALLPWLEKRPMQALALHQDWQRLLAVVGWVVAHPRPGIYLRQVDLPGIHSKFIESQRGVLAELLDLALPAEMVDSTKTGVGQFAGRYGFLDKPRRIRFRILDPGIASLPGLECPDITVDADSFSRLGSGIKRVFITENETNFLAFPPAEHAIVIFGSGYGWDALACSHWLNACAIHYWGDIDTHGFAILDQLRRHFPHVRSFLMDRPTLDAHSAFWGNEARPAHSLLPGLTPDEATLYADLCANRISDGLRLEQEHIHFGWLHGYLRELI